MNPLRWRKLTWTILISGLWFVGFLVLSIVWFMARPRHRLCPRCGEDVKKGLAACRRCGYDFAALPGGSTQPPAANAS